MIDLEGITDFRTEEVNYISSLDFSSNPGPSETYFKTFMTKDGIEAEGIGNSEIEAIISAIDDIEAIKLQHITFEEEIESSSPF